MAHVVYGCFHIMPAIYTFLLCFSFEYFGVTAKYITATQILRDPETLVSSNSVFKAGFFSTTNSKKRYVGIWYNSNKDSDSGISEVVWIANRDNPLDDSSGVLKISKEGKLQLSDRKNKIFWSTDVSQQENKTVAKLLDTGNLVLLSNDSGEIIWQSLEHPTNTWLPSAVQLTFDIHKKDNPTIRSWKSASDPSTGRFNHGIVSRNFPELFTMEGEKPYWRSGPWTSNHFLGVPYMHSEVSSGFQIYDNHEGEIQLSYSLANSSLLERVVMNHDGRVFFEHWGAKRGKWEVVWNSFQSECELYGKCGAFGNCNPSKSPICSCLKGFEPNNRDEWNNGNWNNGCFRRTPLQCGTREGKSDKFLKMRHMKVPDYSYWVSSSGEDDCGTKCSQNCSCLAYAYYPGIGCMMWNVSLMDIQQFSADGADLFIRLAHSELGKQPNL